MAWTTPKTWSSEPLTSIDLNTYVRDNQNHLKDRLDTSVSRIVSGGSLLTTTAQAFVDIDPIHLSLTLTTHGGDVLLGFTGTAQNRANNAVTSINVAVDGVDYFADNGVIEFKNDAVNAVDRNKPLTFVLLISGLGAGIHTFTLRWKTTRGNTARMDVVNVHPQFWAKEI
ncbi:MAG: hypothetical protein OXI34_14945 [Chloroflexota bacterium]|nr:hypothetical protein [Chloroflexota bacterium]MDE2948222.1 hypothetical protein [Chloroflexota bacterium]